MDEGQHVRLGQFLRVNPGLRIVDDHAVHPGPEEPLSVANTGGGGKTLGQFVGATSPQIDWHDTRRSDTYWKGAAELGGIT